MTCYVPVYIIRFRTPQILEAHFEVDPTSDDLIWEIEPQVRGFEAVSYAARELFWNAANRIDQRFGLESWRAALCAYKLTRSDVHKGQK